MYKELKDLLIKVFLPIVLLITRTDSRKALDAFTPVKTEIENCLETDIESNSIVFNEKTSLSLRKLLKDNEKIGFYVQNELELLLKQKKGQPDEVPTLRKLRTECMLELHQTMLSTLLPEGIASKLPKKTVSPFEFDDAMYFLKSLDLRITYLENQPPSPEHDNPRFPASLDIISLRISRTRSISKLGTTAAMARVTSAINQVSDLLPGLQKEMNKEEVNQPDSFTPEQANLFDKCGKTIGNFDKNLGLPKKFLILQEAEFLKLIELNQRICILEKIRNM